ncbi:hypothetical protein [uncultured Roseobacter sp.]|uniref:hypothetical protein n=1 Tax=uncultured Roseobacter sp. TaxID=114847 RepID=UPI00262B029D|nr:hypothetical protein [uncultured Roseobacter sp.]
MGHRLTGLALSATVALSACVAVQQQTDLAGRQAAKTILPEALAIYFPQVPKALFTPFTNCVVDNADASEVQSLAADAVVGVDQGTADTIRTVLARPETQNCLRAAAPTALGTL